MNAPHATAVTEAAAFSDSLKGQEEIYVSDGLAAVQASIPAITQQQLRSTHVNLHPEDILDDGGRIDAAEAFEVFKGKIFLPSSDDDEYYHAHRAPPRNVETPIQRLSRLRMEVSELENDVRQQQQMLIPTNPSEAHNIQDEDDTHQFMLLENMTQMARDLATRLDSISMGTTATLSTSFAAAAGQDAAIHASLTNLVQDQIQQIEKLQQQQPQQQPHSRKDTDSDTASTISHLVLLEQRLTRIEKALGTNTIDLKVPSSSSIIQRLEDAERLISGINKEGLDLIASRAKYIRYVEVLSVILVVLLN